MTAKILRSITIDGDKHEILFSERTGRFACAEQWLPTPNFYATEQEAINHSIEIISKVRNKSISDIAINDKND